MILEEKKNSPYKNLNLSFIQIIGALFNEIFERRCFLKSFIWRGLISDYRRSFIGAIWILLTPIIQIVSWTLLKKASILNPGEISIPYPIYVLSGTLLWGLFITVFNSSLTTLSRYRMMLLRVQISAELFFIIDTILITIPFLISFTLSVIVFLFFNVQISLFIFTLPLLILPLLLFANALGMFLSLFTIISYDFRRIIKAAFSFLMFFTPVVYNYNSLSSGLFKKIVSLNPLTYLITTPRNLILSLPTISIDIFVISSVLSLLMLYISFRLFNITKQRLLERIF